MKIGTFFDGIDLAIENNEVKSMEDAFERLVPLGLSFVDLSSRSLVEKYSTAELSKRLKNSGVFVGSVYHLYPFDYRNKNIIEEKKEDTKRQLEMCTQLECKLFMPVPMIDGEHESEDARKNCRSIVTEYFADVSEQAKNYDIKVIVENYSKVSFPFSKIEDFSYIFSQVPSLYYALDTGNYKYGDSDVLEAMRKLMDITEHIHLKDITPQTDENIIKTGKIWESVALGKGVIPMKEIIAEIKKNGYNKTATIELVHEADLINKIAQSLTYLKNEGINII